MKYFKFVWQNGSTDVGPGDSVEDAFARLGFGGGAIRALDYYSKISEAEFASEMLAKETKKQG